MKLSIALPGLFWPDPGDIEYLAPQVNYLDKLIKRALISQLPYSFSDLIYSSYVQTTPSLARAIAKKMGILDLYPNFLMAEPTYLRANRDCLLICESELLQLKDDEVSSIISSINSHFAGILQLFPVATNLWLIGLNQDINESKFYPILDIIGENIDAYLPVQSIELTKLLNEIQMLLFSLELNKMRPGLIQINSLWLWDKAINSTILDGYTNIFTNNQSINNARIRSLPETMLDMFVDNSLIILDNLYYPCCYRDSQSYLHNLSLIDGQILSILLSNIAQIDCLEILVPGTLNTQVITLNKKDKYKFWRNMSFNQILKERYAS